MKQDSAALHNRLTGLKQAQSEHESDICVSAPATGYRRIPVFCQYGRRRAGLACTSATQLRRIVVLRRLAAFQERRRPMQRMRRLTAFALLAMAACWPGASAYAEPVDLTGASCTDFMGMEEADRNQISLWLAGYYAGVAQRPMLDVTKVLAAPAGLAALCTKTPQAPLIGAETRAVFFPPAP